MPKIETLEALDAAVTGINEKQDNFSASLAALTELNTAQAAALEESKTTVLRFEDKIKTLQAVIKDVQKIDSETSQEAHDYRLGKMASLLYADAAKTLGSREEAAKYMTRIGAIPTVGGTAVKDSGPIAVAEGYESRLTNAIKSYAKAAVSTDPLSSDDTDTGNFYGSYLVPVDTDANLMRIAADSSAMMGLVTSRPVRGITTYMPTTTDALAFTAVTNQETAKTEDNVTFAKTTLTVVTYALWVAITEEMDEDSLIALGALIRTMATEAWALKFDTLCLSDSTYGAMATSGINQVTMGAGDTTFGSITPTYLDNMIAALTTRAKRRGARFFMHPTVWDTVSNLKNANGDYIVRQNVADPGQPVLKGYPVVLSDGMPSTSAVSTDFVAFGNPAYIVNGTKVGFEFRIFDQTYATMQYDQFFLRARLRQAFALWAPSAWVKLTTAA